MRYGIVWGSTGVSPAVAAASRPANLDNRSHYG